MEVRNLSLIQPWSIVKKFNHTRGFTVSRVYKLLVCGNLFSAQGSCLRGSKRCLLHVIGIIVGIPQVVIPNYFSFRQVVDGNHWLVLIPCIYLWAGSQVHRRKRRELRTGKTGKTAGKREMHTLRVLIISVWSRQERRERRARKRSDCTKVTVLGAGYVVSFKSPSISVIGPILVSWIYSSPFSTQIDYFNQRRIIAEAQKDRLSRVSEQSHVVKK